MIAQTIGSPNEDTVNDNDAPRPGCRCDICNAMRLNAAIARGPIQPDTEAWELMLEQIVKGKQ